MTLVSQLSRSAKVGDGSNPRKLRKKEPTFIMVTRPPPPSTTARDSNASNPVKPSFLQKIKGKMQSIKGFARRNKESKMSHNSRAIQSTSTPLAAPADVTTGPTFKTDGSNLEHELAVACNEDRDKSSHAQNGTAQAHHQRAPQPSPSETGSAPFGDHYPTKEDKRVECIPPTAGLDIVDESSRGSEDDVVSENLNDSPALNLEQPCRSRRSRAFEAETPSPASFVKHSAMVDDSPIDSSLSSRFVHVPQFVFKKGAEGLHRQRKFNIKAAIDNSAFQKDTVSALDSEEDQDLLCDLEKGSGQEHRVDAEPVFLGNGGQTAAVLRAVGKEGGAEDEAGDMSITATINDRIKELEARATEANARALEAEARAADAEALVANAEILTANVGTLTAEAETRAAEAEARAANAESQLKDLQEGWRLEHDITGEELVKLRGQLASCAGSESMSTWDQKKLQEDVQHDIGAENSKNVDTVHRLERELEQEIQAREDSERLQQTTKAELEDTKHAVEDLEMQLGEAESSYAEKLQASSDSLEIARVTLEKSVNKCTKLEKDRVRLTTEVTMWEIKLDNLRDDDDIHPLTKFQWLTHLGNMKEACKRNNENCTKAHQKITDLEAENRVTKDIAQGERELLVTEVINCQELVRALLRTVVMPDRLDASIIEQLREAGVRVPEASKRAGTYQDLQFHTKLYFSRLGDTQKDLLFLEQKNAELEQNLRGLKNTNEDLQKRNEDLKIEMDKQLFKFNESMPRKHEADVKLLDDIVLGLTTRLKAEQSAHGSFLKLHFDEKVNFALERQTDTILTLIEDFKIAEGEVIDHRLRCTTLEDSLRQHQRQQALDSEALDWKDCRIAVCQDELNRLRTQMANGDPTLSDPKLWENWENWRVARLEAQSKATKLEDLVDLLWRRVIGFENLVGPNSCPAPLVSGRGEIEKLFSEILGVDINVKDGEKNDSLDVVEIQTCGSYRGPRVAPGPWRQVTTARAEEGSTNTSEGAQQTSTDGESTLAWVDRTTILSPIHGPQAIRQSVISSHHPI